MWEHFTEDEIAARLEYLNKIRRASPSDLNAAYVLGIWEWRQGRHSAAEAIFLDIAARAKTSDEKLALPFSLPDFVLATTRENPDYAWLGYQADPDELAEIATDENEWRQHYVVAANPLTPESAVRTLIEITCAEDEGFAAGGNFGLPDDFYRWFADEASTSEETLGDGALATLAGNPAIPLSVMEALAGSEDEFVRETLSTNLSVPRALLADLAQDRCDSVRDAAQRNPFLIDELPTGDS